MNPNEMALVAETVIKTFFLLVCLTTIVFLIAAGIRKILLLLQKQRIKKSLLKVEFSDYKNGIVISKNGMPNSVVYRREDGKTGIKYLQ